MQDTLLPVRPSSKEDEGLRLDKGCREFYLVSGETIIQEKENAKYPR